MYRPAPSLILAGRSHVYPGAVAASQPCSRVNTRRSLGSGFPASWEPAGPAPPEPTARSPPGRHRRHLRPLFPPRAPHLTLLPPGRRRTTQPASECTGTGQSAAAAVASAPDGQLSLPRRRPGASRGGPAPARPPHRPSTAPSSPGRPAPRGAQPRLTASETPRNTHPGGSSRRCCCCCCRRWDRGRRPRRRHHQHRRPHRRQHPQPSSSSCCCRRRCCPLRSCQWLRLRDCSWFPSPPF